MFITDLAPFTAKRSVVWVLLVTAVFQPSSEIDGLSASEPASAGRLGEHAKRCDAQFVNRNVVFEEVVINRDPVRSSTVTGEGLHGLVLE